jgi:hypothetical protein
MKRHQLIKKILSEGLNLLKKPKVERYDVRNIFDHTHWDEDDLDLINTVGYRTNSEPFTNFTTGGNIEIFALQLPNQKILYISNVDDAFYITPNKYDDPGKFYDDFWDDVDSMSSITIPLHHTTPLESKEIDNIITDIMNSI